MYIVFESRAHIKHDRALLEWLYFKAYLVFDIFPFETGHYWYAVNYILYTYAYGDNFITLSKTKNINLDLWKSVAVNLKTGKERTLWYNGTDVASVTYVTLCQREAEPGYFHILPAPISAIGPRPCHSSPKPRRKPTRTVLKST